MDLPPELAALVTRAAENASASRTRQLRWVAGGMTLAAEQMGWHARTLTDWFAPAFLDRYLRAAEQGQFRQRSSTRPVAASPASVRVRRSCVAALATAAGAEVAVPATGRSPDPLPAPPLPARRQALQWWRAEALRSDATEASVRAAAVAHLVHELGLRTSEVVAMQVEDVDLSGHRIRYTPTPQAARSTRPPVWVSISPGAAEILSRWLQVRAGAVTLTPHIKALWVSLAGNHDGDRVIPAGLPLRARGLARAHQAAIERVNMALAGEPGWQPLPATLSDLRRGALQDAASDDHAAA